MPWTVWVVIGLGVAGALFQWRGERFVLFVMGGYWRGSVWLLWSRWRRSLLALVLRRRRA
jgi:hypothetical protein